MVGWPGVAVLRNPGADATDRPCRLRRLSPVVGRVACTAEWHSQFVGAAQPMTSRGPGGFELPGREMVRPTSRTSCHLPRRVRTTRYCLLGAPIDGRGCVSRGGGGCCLAHHVGSVFDPSLVPARLGVQAIRRWRRWRWVRGRSGGGQAALWLIRLASQFKRRCTLATPHTVWPLATRERIRTHLMRFVAVPTHTSQPLACGFGVRSSGCRCGRF